MHVGDGDLDDLQAGTSGAHQQLDVVCPAATDLDAEQLARIRGRQQLEAALRVAEAQPRQPPNREVEALPQALAVGRSVLDQGAAPHARADGDRRSLVKRSREMTQIAQRSRKVDVRQQHVIPAGGPNSGGDRRALASVAVVTDHHTHESMHRGGLAQQIGSAVRAAVVNDHRLQEAQSRAGGHRLRAAGQLPDKPRQSLLLVEGRDDDRQAGSPRRRLHRTRSAIQDCVHSRPSRGPREIRRSIRRSRLRPARPPSSETSGRYRPQVSRSSTRKPLALSSSCT
ncbi:hypothetical protein BH20ACT17_BH20ACT17_06850 [soil metagenome]